MDESFSAACPLLSLDLADAASRHCGGSARQSQGVSKALKQKMLRQFVTGCELLVENQWWMKVTQIVKVRALHSRVFIYSFYTAVLMCTVASNGDSLNYFTHSLVSLLQFVSSLGSSKGLCGCQMMTGREKKMNSASYCLKQLFKRNHLELRRWN